MRRSPQRQRADLIRIANEAMLERGLEPAFPPKALRELAAITAPGQDDDPRILGFRALPWCSLDNDDSLDLDQITACEALADGRVKLFVAVAVADVDALVRKGTAIDSHAWVNTTSVYTSWTTGMEVIRSITSVAVASSSAKHPVTLFMMRIQ